MTFASWASVPIQDYRQLPAISGIYACLNADAEPVYIGQAKNIHARWERGHHRAVDVIYAGAVRIAWVAASLDKLNDMEAELLSTHSPSLNSAVVHTNAVRLQRSWQRRLSELKRLNATPSRLLMGSPLQGHTPMM